MSESGERLWRTFGYGRGWSLDKCEELVEEYSKDEYKEDLEMEEEDVQVGD
jgi:hypothetical protein